MTHVGGGDIKSCSDLYPRTKKLAYEISFALDELEARRVPTDEAQHALMADLARLYDNLHCFDSGVKRASFVDTQWSALADALRASDEVGGDVSSSFVDASTQNPDMFGTILGLDNGVANVGNFGRAALLFAVITVAEIMIGSATFGVSHGGVMWLKVNAVEQAKHRKLLYLVRRAQLSHKTIQKHRNGMDFLR